MDLKSITHRSVTTSDSEKRDEAGGEKRPELPTVVDTTNGGRQTPMPDDLEPR